MFALWSLCDDCLGSLFTVALHVTADRLLYMLRVYFKKKKQQKTRNFLYLGVTIKFLIAVRAKQNSFPSVGEHCDQRDILRPILATAIRTRFGKVSAFIWSACIFSETPLSTSRNDSRQKRCAFFLLSFREFLSFVAPSNGVNVRMKRIKTN